MRGQALRVERNVLDFSTHQASIFLNGEDQMFDWSMVSRRRMSSEVDQPGSTYLVCAVFVFDDDVLQLNNGSSQRTRLYYLEADVCRMRKSFINQLKIW
jgi:hypothetical protein